MARRTSPYRLNNYGVNSGSFFLSCWRHAIDKLYFCVWNTNGFSSALLKIVGDAWVQNVSLITVTRSDVSQVADVVAEPTILIRGANKYDDTFKRDKYISKYKFQ